MLKLDESFKKENLINELDGFIELFPSQAEFYAERGMANVLSFNYVSALNDFSRAIELDEFNEANYRNRGLCLHNIKRYNAAIEDYTKSIEILVKKYQSSNYAESIKKILAQTFTMRGMTYELNRNADQACDDFYNAAKLGSKVGLNNYRRNCNVYFYPLRN
jgi:tetratricopeptide (TPR) repeat protein